MKIELSPGELLMVTLQGTDGMFTIEFGERELTVSVDLPDTEGREGVIYSERFMEEHEKRLSTMPDERVAMVEARCTCVNAGQLLTLKDIRDCPVHGA